MTEFEVASVRLVPEGKGGLFSISPSGSHSFTAENASMQILLSMAYGVDSDRISGPGWIESQQYDVSAKWEGGAKLTYAELRFGYRNRNCVRMDIQPDKA